MATSIIAVAIRKLTKLNKLPAAVELEDNKYIDRISMGEGEVPHEAWASLGGGVNGASAG